MKKETSKSFDELIEYVKKVLKEDKDYWRVSNSLNYTYEEFKNKWTIEQRQRIIEFQISILQQLKYDKEQEWADLKPEYHKDTEPEQEIELDLEEEFKK